MAALAVAVDALFGPAGGSLTREGGALETVTAMLYFAAAALLVVRLGRSARWQFGVILIAMGLREFDADKRFTSEGVLSTKIFIYDTPIWEKILAAVVLILLIAAVATLAIHGRTALRNAIGRRETWPIYVIGAVVLVVVSKTIDGIGRKLAPYGISLSEHINTVSGAVEEVLELGIPIMLIMAIVELSRQFRPDPAL